jgi:hypothetical protein
VLFGGAAECIRSSLLDPAGSEHSRFFNPTGRRNKKELSQAAQKPIMANLISVTLALMRASGHH